MCWACVTSSSRRSLKLVSDSPDAARSPPSKESPSFCSGDLPTAMRKLFRTFQRAWRKASAPFLGGCAFLHEQSYLRVGFFPPFSPRMASPDHRWPKLHVRVTGNGKEYSWSWHGYDCS